MSSTLALLGLSAPQLRRMIDADPAEFRRVVGGAWVVWPKVREAFASPADLRAELERRAAGNPGRDMP